jgi:hypothetical protein
MGKAHYKCLVEGTYYCFTEGVKAHKPYAVILNVPVLKDENNGEAGDMAYLSLIKNKMLSATLAAKYPDSRGYRTHVLVNRTIVNGAGKKETPDPSKHIDDMNRDDLVAYIHSKRYPIIIECYRSLIDIKDAVASYINDSGKFLAKQDELLVQKQLDDELAELNPQMVADLATPINLIPDVEFGNDKCKTNSSTTGQKVTL